MKKLEGAKNLKNYRKMYKNSIIIRNYYGIIQNGRILDYRLLYNNL